MKRAKLRWLKRNAAVVLGNIGEFASMDMLTPALDDRAAGRRARTLGPRTVPCARIRLTFQPLVVAT